MTGTGSLRTRILLAGAIVALLDISYAALLYVGVLKVITLPQLPQSIAAGLLGRAAFQGGGTTALLGAALHILIAYGWTLVYFTAVRRWPALRARVQSTRGAVKVGLVYGALVWLAMSLVVLPLSRAHAPSVFTWVYFANLIQHTVMVGLPIVLLVRRGD